MYLTFAILCVFYMCAAIGVIINDEDDDDDNNSDVGNMLCCAGALGKSALRLNVSSDSLLQFIFCL